MKKNIIYYLFTISIVFASCEKDRLDLAPFDSVSAATALNTAGDFELAVDGLYYMMLNSPYYGADLMCFPDVLADNLIFNPDGRQTQKVYFEWRYDANSAKRNFMGDCADVIQQANFILENIDKLDEGDFKDDIMAKALAARALSHFDLVKVYGKIPTQSADANGSLGVPYLTSSDIRQLPSRNTVGEVYTNIINDLEMAKSMIGSDNDVYGFNIEAINGLLSRAYLYNGNYSSAITAANAVTTTVSSFGNFVGLWDDSSAEGVLFKLKNLDSEQGIGVGIPYSQTLTAGIYSEYLVSYSFNELFIDDDIRKAAYVNTSAYNGLLYNHVAKYLSSAINQGSGVVDVKVIRAAEVYLNKAEAYAEMDQDGMALAALDAVRSERYTDFVSGGETGQDLKDAIQLERRLELAFEGHRFFDIKRHGLPVQRDNFGEFADGSGSPAFVQTLPSGDCRFQLAIPKAEIDVNPNMVQNPCTNY
ncbi:RagB/SusD family nutrient uptake outer membrane protein [Yeosuana sp. MJ-SS3]|uniref:RagB/SusD family nutrient uptake outer membrane protein n=1 Tax=Gilvirhabdus luticola TaxID=3079858 RepID=A0ABU3U4Q5_9FLAO|nr:RagB/SusD family nutrient uptake outer membrane protein [Yeosuana sp. MJ-SS3]MDU8885397.1 RagB/SusD family nutrient uptake outer membrane protein [Yeosuana sp. MJ-SS3]